MNTIWSTYIQNTNTLYLSRSMRFSDSFKEVYQKAFAISEDSRILEIGCGPGALSESLQRWYPQSQITGIDRDSCFVDFACAHVPGVTFMEGDATALPFEDGTFDVTIFNTVAEHIDPAKFYGEQHRVLKKNGVCLVLSARRGISVPASCIAEETEFERELWRRAELCFRDAHGKYHVGEYAQNEAELPLNMEKYGFTDVQTDFIAVHLTPDDPAYSPELAYTMIEANRQNDLENADRMLHIAGEVVTVEEVEMLKTLINARYDKRISFYDQGIKQWDTSVSLTMVVRGVKRS